MPASVPANIRIVSGGNTRGAAMWQTLEEWDADGEPALYASYVYGNYIDEVLSMRKDIDGAATTHGTEDYYFHQDDLFNVVLVTDSGGDAAERYEYGDYGAPFYFTGAGSSTPSSAINNTRLFNGREWDDESRFYYYRTRYLEPTMGRFTTRDTIGVWGDAGNVGSGLAFVAARPLSRSDPSGLSCSDQTSPCVRACEDGCPRVWSLIPGPAEIGGPGRLDPVCLRRCKMACGALQGANVACKPNGIFRWEARTVGGENGPGELLYPYTINGENSGCCTKVAAVQLARLDYGLGFGGWWFDSGYFGVGSESSGQHPYYYPPVGFDRTGTAFQFLNDSPGLYFLPSSWEFRVFVMCVEGEGAGHIYGSASWSVGVGALLLGGAVSTPHTWQPHAAPPSF